MSMMGNDTCSLCAKNSRGGNQAVSAAPQHDGDAGNVGAAALTARAQAAKIPAMTAPYRILIAEDHTILREGLRSLLTEHRDFAIVGEAGDGLAAIALVKKLKPDLVLMDLSMPRLTGLDAIREITKRHPATRIVALTVHKTEEYVLAARAAGALGYVLKDDSSAELLAAIRSVLAGKPYLSAEVRALLPPASPGSRGGKNGTLWDTVTPRERAVMKLIAEGHKNREIAGLLGISAKTVEKHRANLMGKLELHNTAAVTAFAAKKGLIS